jgi:RES domain-containing protein
LGPAGEIFHRFLTPKWAHLPTSGAGAATDGGRFNRPGIEALYLSRAPQTALEEYRQGASITPPATLAAYIVRLNSIVDLSEGFDPLVWDLQWAEWDCQWRKIARVDRRTCILVVIGYRHHGRIQGNPLSLAPACRRNKPRCLQCQPRC